MREAKDQNEESLGLSTLWIATLQSAGYHPHGACYLWESDLLWTHVASDGLIALAYYSIPIGLVYFVRKRRDVPFDWMFVAFAVFILACGTTHAMAVWTMWNPDYWASAGVKIVTAGASLATAGLMIPFLPRAIDLPSHAELEEKNRELERAHSEIVDLNDRLETKVSELQTANADLEAFAYSISHDLKAPLRAMEGFSTALLEDCSDQLDETCRDYADRIVSSSRRMNRQIEDLLEHSRLALADLGTEPVDLGSLFEEVVASLAGPVRDTGAEVRLEPGGLAVEAHRDTLATMLSNLLMNAMTYVEPDRAPRIVVRAEERGRRVRISVIDNGIGVAFEHREKIFQIFTRLHGMERYPGTGIGLATVAKGAERMGGSAGVESEVGEGSEFWIELPRPEDT